MARFDLQVPFAEKDEAKSLGARWDPTNKVWYVPEGKDPILFKKWLPAEPDIQIRASSYFIAETAKPCWKCGKLTKVFGFVIPAGHEVLEEVELDDCGSRGLNSAESIELQWVICNEPVIIHFIEYLPQMVIKRVQQLTRHYSVDHSKQADGSYWMNHCEHCGMKQGDFNMYQEPGGAFFPTTREEAVEIILHQIDEPFTAGYGASSASIGYIDMSNPDGITGAELLDFMTKK